MEITIDIPDRLLKQANRNKAVILVGYTSPRAPVVMEFKFGLVSATQVTYFTSPFSDSNLNLFVEPDPTHTISQRGVNDEPSND